MVSNVSFVEDWKGLAIYHDSLSGMFCYIGLPRYSWSNNLSSIREFCYRVGL